MVTPGNLIKLRLVRQVSGQSQLGCFNQLVGNSAQCRYYDNHRLLFSLNNLFNTQNAFYGTYGCSPKF